MAEQLLSVGIDVGTTTSQLIFSRLTIANSASSFSVPKLEIADREILFESDISFTPLLNACTIDASGLREIVAAAYKKAGIHPEQVETGAVIITGETARKENARTVLQALAEFAGDFVVATAGPELESILAAKGAGADRYAAETGKTVLHMDIGGGTSNLALYDENGLVDAGCLNVGGRLLKIENSKITYVSPVLEGLTNLSIGETASEEALRPLVRLLTDALEQAAGLQPETELLRRLTTSKTVKLSGKPLTISFSGGVAQAMLEQPENPFAFGDIGALLARAILDSRLCKGEHRISPSPIRATVIGAGCHSTTLSGSTVFLRRLQYPIKNLPVCQLNPKLPLAAQMRQKAAAFEENVIFSLPGRREIGFDQVVELAKELQDGFTGKAAFIALEQDCAKALGQCLALLLPENTPILCLDGLTLEDGAYLDVARPLAEGAVPVIIKTLVLPTATK